MERDEFLDLFQQVKAVHTRRFLEVVEPFFPHLKRLTRAMLPNPADSEDILQETILKALQHIDQLREVQCFKGWLFQIALNEARLRMRGNRRFGTEPQEELPDEEEDFGSTTAIERLADKGDLPLKIVERSELLPAVKRTLPHPNPTHPNTFALRTYYAFT